MSQFPSASRFLRIRLIHIYPVLLLDPQFAPSDLASQHENRLFQIRNHTCAAPICGLSQQWADITCIEGLADKSA